MISGSDVPALGRNGRAISTGYAELRKQIVAGLQDTSIVIWDVRPMD
jgi:hypothetical protein